MGCQLKLVNKMSNKYPDTLQTLINALLILRQYGDVEQPISGEDTQIHVDPAKVRLEDIKTLEQMGFYADAETKSFWK